MENKMQHYLPEIEQEKMKRLHDIEDRYHAGDLTLEEARRELAEKVGKVNPYHIAYVEQTMTEESDDECIREDIHQTLHLLDGLMDTSLPDLPETHPIMHYLRENEEMRRLLLAVEDLMQYPMIKNQWLELYDRIKLYPIHYKRKQNQLYPVLEKKGFTRPTTTMWTFDDLVRDIIRDSERLLGEMREEEFIAKQQELLDYCRDLMHKEEAILYPTSMAMISPKEFEEMKEGDQEIGFAFFDVVPEETAHTAEKAPEAVSAGFAADLQALLGKYGYTSGGSDKLDVTTGRLTLEQINLIYKHLPIDISFVDENELVCFYSDTDHRIFPRSKNVIGREVMNCHPKKSAHVVREVIDKLRSGEQDRAEFWINKPGLFIYIVYVAVRDKDGKFRGVLEMMQDCTHIRALEGSQTLLTWAGENVSDKASAAPEAKESEPGSSTPTVSEAEAENPSDSSPAPSVTAITPETRLKDLLKQYPDLKKRLPEIAPEFKMLSSPLGKIIAAKADVRMMSERSGVELNSLIGQLKRLIGG